MTPTVARSTLPTTLGPVVVRRVPLDAIPRSTWTRLLAITARPTPFSRWTLHRAWWDAYGSTAHEQYLVCARGEPGRAELVDEDIVAIVPLMHRHEVEPQDAASYTPLRRPVDGTPVPPDATAVFMAASYHADYATILCDPDDLPEVCNAVVAALAALVRATEPWDVIDLRRLRDDDPARSTLVGAMRAGPDDWTVHEEQEDVCPVVTLPDGGWDDYLATLDKKARHEIRRKVRRAEAAGAITFRGMPLDATSVDAFIDLHQARWGDHGLFPDTEGGERSRRFLHRLTELEAAEGDEAQLQLGQVFVGERLIFAGVGFDDGTTCYFYNAGADPDARDLSPGVTGTAAYIRDRMEAGRRRFDFLRGNEPYKYEWGAVDEPIHRIVAIRGDS
jgi:hypothetical protein